MLDNGITVYCDGETRHLELDKRQAEKSRRPPMRKELMELSSLVPAQTTTPFFRYKGDKQGQRCQTY